MAKHKDDRDAGLPGRRNFVSEWFGHRIFPAVAKTGASLNDQKAGCCPFLSTATHEERRCIKPASSSGVCTISACSNGPRQDWLVCPYRALDRRLLEDAAKRLFALDSGHPLMVIPAPTLSKDEVRRALINLVNAGNAGIVYLQDKLGGEISISATDRSPELAFDITMAEITIRSGTLGIGRYGILEVQTMDFHGSYKHAVNNLKDALRLHADEFPRVLQENQGWLSDRIEGPNIANVFKRTFYQMMLKFQIGEHESCAGCVLAIPMSVWDSWQKHLGKPELEPRPDGTFVLKRPTATQPLRRTPAWIYVFDINASSPTSPNPIEICRVIATDPESVSYYALKVAPDAAVAAGGSADRVLATIRHRLSLWWPDLAAAN